MSEYDKIFKINNSLVHAGSSNSRVYLLNLDKNDLNTIVNDLEAYANEHNYSKIFTKVPGWAKDKFEENDYELEASIPKFYYGKDTCYFYSKFLDQNRKDMTSKVKETVNKNIQIAKEVRNNYDENLKLDELNPKFEIKKLDKNDLSNLANLYKLVFKTYPFPVFEVWYLEETMKTHVDYFGVFYENTLVGASSIEKDEKKQNAEMTDFAVNPDFRGNKLASYLLFEMENYLKNSNIKTAYTIARALSAGMNITFAKLGYNYSGTLVNNTQVSGSIEPMNVCYKNL